MNTKQPAWTYAGNLGDATPLDHGGAFLLIDATGVYAPELEIYDADSREVSRVCLDPVHECPDLPGSYGDNPHHPNKPAWWDKNLQSIADTCGMEKAELAAMLCSDDATERAEGYLALIAHHGVFEFDQYPLKVTRSEAAERIAAIEALPAAL
jgi:hypothetical protein